MKSSILLDFNKKLSEGQKYIIPFHNIGFNEISREQFIEAKQGIFENESADPAFYYMHTYSPGHSQNSGACRSDETERYAEKLDRANIEMRQDLETIMKKDPSKASTINLGYALEDANKFATDPNRTCKSLGS